MWDNESAVGSWRAGRPVLTEAMNGFRSALGAIGVRVILASGSGGQRVLDVRLVRDTLATAANDSQMFVETYEAAVLGGGLSLRISRPGTFVRDLAGSELMGSRVKEHDQSFTAGSGRRDGMRPPPLLSGQDEDGSTLVGDGKTATRGLDG